MAAITKNDYVSLTLGQRISTAANPKKVNLQHDSNFCVKDNLKNVLKQIVK